MNDVQTDKGFADIKWIEATGVRKHWECYAVMHGGDGPLASHLKVSQLHERSIWAWQAAELYVERTYRTSDLVAYESDSVCVAVKIDPGVFAMFWVKVTMEARYEARRVERVTKET